MHFIFAATGPCRETMIIFDTKQPYYMMRLIVLLSLSIVLLSGCNMDKLPDSIIPKEANDFAINYLNRLSAGDTAYCLSGVGYDNLTSDGRQLIIKVSGYLENKKLASSRIINVVQQTGLRGGENRTDTHLEYEYVFGPDYVYFTVDLRKEDGAFKIFKFDAGRSNVSIFEANKFTMSGKSFMQYLFLALGISLIIFKAVTLFAAIKTPMPAKGLWIAFILISCCTFSIDWTTAETSASLLRIGIIGAGMSKTSLVGAWIVHVSIPLGATIFWWKRMKIKREQKKQEE
jgi:hypothetical protein